jgi:radical SAM superfamily enzyme YgiQ (UPF0313 family)
MKVAFVIPPRLHELEPYAQRDVVRHSINRPPLGLLYVAAALRERTGIETVFIDCPLNNYSIKDLEVQLARVRPDVVGFSVLTYNLLDCLEAAQLVRKVTPDALICFGGWHPTLYPRETLALNPVDIVVLGEGEHTFSEIIASHLKIGRFSEEELCNIDGIGFVAADGQPLFTSPRRAIKKLDELPLPAYDLADWSKYSNVMANTSNVINIMTSRGCPHKCVFCDMRLSLFRQRSSANVFAEIRHWVDRGVNEFYIQDDNFTIGRKRTIELCKMIIESGMKINYKVSSRVDRLDDETYSYLRKSGCYRIHFGVESGSNEILNFIQKGITIEQTQEAFSLAKKYGIDRFAYIMIGHPMENFHHIKETMKLIKKIKPDYLHCSICTPMPQTFLYRKMLEEGLIKNDYWLEFARDPNSGFQPQYASRVFGPEELRKIQDSIHRRFYMRPGLLVKEALMTRSLKQLKNKARLALRLVSGG